MSEVMHPQIDVDGVMIDVEMERLVRTAWRMGWKTSSSCQGHDGDEAMMPSLGLVDADDAIEALRILRPLVRASGDDEREATVMVAGPCAETDCTCEMTGDENALVSWWPREVTEQFADALTSHVERMEAHA